MKRYLILLAALAAVTFTLSAVAATVQPVPFPPIKAASIGTSAGTNPTVVLSANGVQPVPAINYINASATEDAATIGFLAATNGLIVSGSATSRVFFASTNGIRSGTVVLRHVASDKYETATMTAGATNTATFASAPATALLVGDQVYVMDLVATLPVGSNSVAYANSPLVVGKPWSPVLVQITGTNARLSTVTWSYLPLQP